MATVGPKMASWADDDSSVSPSEPEVVGFTSTASESDGGRTGEPKFKIQYAKHPTTYARTLFDVEGRVLVDEDGNPVNIFTPKMKELMTKKSIVCHHRPGRPGYRYFTVHSKQADLFKKARARGTTPFIGPYHVYPDEPGCILPFEEGTPTAL